MISTEARILLNRLKTAQDERGPIDSVPLSHLRSGLKFLLSKSGFALPKSVRVENHAIKGPYRDIPLRFYWHTPKEEVDSIVLWYCGGGHVVGNLDQNDGLCGVLARRSKSLVIAVEYAQAPEFRFPKGIDESFVAFRWVRENAAEIVGMERPLRLFGASAGANMVINICKREFERVGHCGSIEKIALAYPNTDWRGKSPSMEEYLGYFIDQEQFDFYRDQYLESPKDVHNEEASPILLKDKSFFPPSYVFTAECDPLRDEAETFAKEMRAQGVSVELERVDGMVHGFLSFSKVLPEAFSSLKKVISFFDQA